MDFSSLCLVQFEPFFKRLIFREVLPFDFKLREEVDIIIIIKRRRKDERSNTNEREWLCIIVKLQHRGNPCGCKDVEYVTSPNESSLEYSSLSNTLTDNNSRSLSTVYRVTDSSHLAIEDEKGVENQRKGGSMYWFLFIELTSG